MVLKQRRYLAGGVISSVFRQQVYDNAPWFDSKCTRLIDAVMTFLPFIAKQDEKTANELVDYIFDKFRAYNLPNAPESWKDSQIEPLRLYYHIMEAADMYKNSANYLLNHIKIDGEHFYIVETHGQGDNQ